MQKIEKLFKGEFLVDAKSLRQKLKNIRAYIFDWDGVFNDGHKTESGSSSFSEIDSMGTNLLRYSHYLAKSVVPYTAIISGEQNKTAETFVKREHFDFLYSGIKNKYDALQHFCRLKNIEASEVAFVFDDVLDLSVAVRCGLRIIVSRESSSAFTRFVKKKKLADYFTYSSGANNAVRESAELIMCLCGEYENAVQNRMDYSQSYSEYLGKRNSSEIKLFGKKDLSNQ
jgi:3-deoxy-D-manno-octulosonate 8-phosphate phosphatase (KDO 8-P phosphatase)